jgi:protein arginine N-methyltransferase 2
VITPEKQLKMEITLPDVPQESIQRLLQLVETPQSQWKDILEEEIKHSKHSIQSFLTCARNVDGKTALHFAFKSKQLPLVQFLTSQGLPWNVVDNLGKTAPEGVDWKEGWDWLRDEAVRYELIMSAMQQRGTRNDTGVNPDNALYLSQPLSFVEKGVDGKQDVVLVDALEQGVMMGWELPLMQAHVNSFMKHRIPQDTVVLNIGFGLGLIDQEFQKYPLKQHHIIEAHPDVLAKMEEDGWMEKSNVVVHRGRWQDVLSCLSNPFDIIYFDTFSEDYWDMQELHEELPNLMQENGQYSWFNGLGGTNPFFHDVFCELARVELQDLGFEVEYEPMQVDSEHVWNGIKRRYWDLPVYNLPRATFNVL